MTSWVRRTEKLDKYWSQQIEESPAVVITQSAEVGAAEVTLTELRRTVQSLEIDLDSMINTKISVENSLREVEARYARRRSTSMGSHCTWSQSWHRPGQRDSARPRNGEDFSLGDARDSSNSLQTILKSSTTR
ncbi:hypothetical protein P7K49_013183 [Saguinus oedipus]|uniref:IF rod domain-containing protein n=1 Tax=Saguinus oedipus TaxID=9490 RepID=A0ABQ9VF64_SAGOE|nr:hypothetical protein P7K49_013183 [Saguinus oedipus]